MSRKSGSRGHGGKQSNTCGKGEGNHDYDVIGRLNERLIELLE
jgi:hypothetical protein